MSNFSDEISLITKIKQIIVQTEISLIRKIRRIKVQTYLNVNSS